MIFYPQNTTMQAIVVM